MTGKLAGTSTIFMVLFFFSLRPGLSALPLTESLYMVPESRFEFALSEDFHHTDDFYTRESLSLGIGILPSLSLWFDFNLLHRHGNKPFGENVLGDIGLRLKFYICDCASNRLHIAFLTRLRLPTGPDAWLTSDWRGVALGKNELAIGPIFRVDIPGGFFLQLNVFYTFREGTSEDYWGGWYLNPFVGETWVKIFGLNPAEPDTFFSIERLKNDYFTFSLAANTDRIYPFVPYLELYGSVRVTRPPEDDIRVEAAGINVFMISAGIRYFFTTQIYLGLYGVVNPLWQDGFTRARYGLEASFQF